MRVVYLKYLVLLLMLLFSIASNGQFKLKTSSYRGAIQWEYSLDRNIWNVTANGTSDSLLVNPTKTTFYRAKITESGCDPIFSDIKGVYVDSNFSVSGKIITGKVIVPSGSSLSPASLEVISLIDKVHVNTDGSFNVFVIDSASQDVLFVLNSDGEAIMLQNLFSDSPVYEISPETTASGMLLLYPFLKPVGLQQKKVLDSIYKTQPEFPQLVSLLQQTISAGKGIFRDSSKVIDSLIAKIINKEYNKNRFRTISSNNRPQGNDIELTTIGPKIKFENNTAYSFGGAIYEKGSSTASKTFTLAGSLMEESTFTKYLYNLITKTNTSNPTEINLNDFQAAPGQYEIKFRSGLSRDGSEEDALGGYENIITLLANVLDNIVPGMEISKDKCIQAFYSYLVDRVKADAAQAIDPQKFDYLKDLSDHFTDYTSFVQNCSGQKVNVFLAKMFEYVQRIKQVLDALPTLNFVREWLTGPSKINFCQFLKDDNSLINCFDLEKAVSPLNTSWVCSDMIVGAIAIDNEGNPSSNLNLVWHVVDGNGVLYDEATKTWKKSINVVTDANGKTNVQWQLGDQPSPNKVAVSAFVSRPQIILIKNLEFATNSLIPQPKLNPLNDGQPGIANQKLPKPIGFWITESSTGDIVPYGKYTVSYNIVGGGSLNNIIDPFGATVADEWTLGPEYGEQSVAVTVRRFPCLNETEGQIVATYTFKATALTGYFLKPYSSQTLSGQIGTMLPDPIIVKVTDMANIPKKGIKIKWMTNSGAASLNENYTDDNGEAKVFWTLGTDAEQNLVARAFYNDIEVSGSPITFKAQSIANTYTVIKPTQTNGDNQTAEINSPLLNPLAILVYDKNGFGVEGISTEWTITSGGGKIEVINPKTDNLGIVKAQWTLGPAVGEQQVTVKAFGPDGKEVIGSPLVFRGYGHLTYSITLNPSSNNQTGIAGQKLDQLFKVRAMGSNNLPAAGVYIQWLANDGSFVNVQQYTDQNGEAVAEWRLGTKLGQQTGVIKAFESNFFGAKEINGSPINVSAYANNPADTMHFVFYWGEWPDNAWEIYTPNDGIVGQVIEDIYETQSYGWCYDNTVVTGNVFAGRKFYLRRGQTVTLTTTFNYLSCANKAPTSVSQTFTFK